MGIEKIEGIGPANSEKLSKAGIRSITGILKEGSTSKGRQYIAEQSGISKDRILDFVNMADLFRIKGVSTQYSELLKATGVDTVKELAQRNYLNLHTGMIKTNAEKKLVRQLPAQDSIKDWIEQAKNLPRIIEY